MGGCFYRWAFHWQVLFVSVRSMLSHWSFLFGFKYIFCLIYWSILTFSCTQTRLRIDKILQGFSINPALWSHLSKWLFTVFLLHAVRPQAHWTQRVFFCCVIPRMNHSYRWAPTSDEMRVFLAWSPYVRFASRSRWTITFFSLLSSLWLKSFPREGGKWAGDATVCWPWSAVTVKDKQGRKGAPGILWAWGLICRTQTRASRQQ